MNLQRRIAEARRASLVRPVGRGRGFASWRRRGRAAPDVDAASARPIQEDFEHAIRF